MTWKCYCVQRFQVLCPKFTPNGLFFFHMGCVCMNRTHTCSSEGHSAYMWSHVFLLPHVGHSMIPSLLFFFIPLTPQCFKYFIYGVQFPSRWNITEVKHIAWGHVWFPPQGLAAWKGRISANSLLNSNLSDSKWGRSDANALLKGMLTVEWLHLVTL